MGRNRISDHLALAGVSISFPTVQHILNKQGLGTRYEHLLKLEERVATEAITLSDKQIRSGELVSGLISGSVNSGEI